MLGLAEVVLALHGQQLSKQMLSQQQLAAVAHMPHQLREAKFLRGKGGELMRSAICRSSTPRHIQLLGHLSESLLVCMKEGAPLSAFAAWRSLLGAQLALSCLVGMSSK